MIKYIKLFLPLLLIFLILFFVPFISPSSLYCPVSDPVDHWMGSNLCITNKELGLKSIPEFIIYNNKLYLKVQTTRYALILITYTSFKDWDENKIIELRKKNPELERYWPDVQKSNAGIQWIK
jgi:hypothetical protein